MNWLIKSLKKIASGFQFQRIKEQKSMPVIPCINIKWNILPILLLTFTALFFFSLSFYHLKRFIELRCFCWFLFLLQSLAIKCVIQNVEEQPFVIASFHFSHITEWVVHVNKKKNDGNWISSYWRNVSRQNIQNFSLFYYESFYIFQAYNVCCKLKRVYD